METSERLVILTTPSRNDGVRSKLNVRSAPTANTGTSSSSNFPTWKRPSKPFGTARAIWLP